MAKNRFFGKYYKFISPDGNTFALIQSHSNEGDMLQLITKDGAHLIDDPHSLAIEGNEAKIHIEQEDIKMVGEIVLGELHPLSHKVMGPFTYLPMECRHEIYSMSHGLSGSLTINGTKKSFDGGLGYIEGDSGTNFPKKYVWYNSVLEGATVTLAIATIPLLGFIHFVGLLCFIKTKDKEYRFCTYNGGKPIKIDEQEIVIKKGRYRLSITIPHLGGHDLKAPIKGDMVRYIKENINVPTSYKLTYKDEVLLENEDPLSSLEFMW